jgi:hypothetical protein
MCLLPSMSGLLQAVKLAMQVHRMRSSMFLKRSGLIMALYKSSAMREPGLLRNTELLMQWHLREIGLSKYTGSAGHAT